MKTFVASAWKAILAFLVLFISNVVMDLQNGAPWPQNGGDWARFLLTTFGGTVAVYMGPSNKTPPAPLTDPLKTPLGNIVQGLAGKHEKP